jgi:hypothetical protein
MQILSFFVFVVLAGLFVLAVGYSLWFLQGRDDETDAWCLTRCDAGRGPIGRGCGAGLGARDKEMLSLSLSCQKL